MTNKKSLIQEWASIFNRKKDWKRVSELAETSLVQTRPKTQMMLSFFAKVGQLDLGKLSSKNSLEAYSKIPLSDSDWKKLATEIPRVCSLVIKLKQIDKNPIPSNLELQHFFLEKQMSKHLNIQQNKNEKLLETTPDNEYYNKLYLTRFNELLLFDVNIQDIRQRNLNLSKWEFSVEQFYCITKLRIIIEITNRSTYSNKFELSEEQKKWVEEIPDYLLENPIIKMFYLIFQMMYHKSSTIYLEILDKLKTANNQTFSPNNIKDFILNLNSFCVQQSYRGHKDSYANYVDLVKFQIEKNLILDSGVISLIRLKNAVKSGLESKQIKWTINFFNTHRQFTIKKSSNNVEEFCLAMIHFYQYEYEKAENILSILPFLKDDFIKIDSFSLYLITLLILGKYSEAERIRINLREMIYRKEVVSNSKLQETQKIIHFSRLIIKKGNLPKKSHYIDISQELEEDLNFKAKTWIQRYIETKN